jgi:AcrR family transcriptional regulator
MDPVSDTDGEAARRGRRRSQGSRQAILAAALALTAEAGYAGLTVDGIAARAGTGKQTIYRWWPSKDDVLLEALAAKADLDIPVPDEGSYQADLRAFLDASFALGRRRQVGDVLRALMARAQIDEGFGQRFRAGFLQRRRDALAVILDRAQARGELPVGLPPGTITDIVFGVIWYRLLATGRQLDDQLAGELATTLAGPQASASSPAPPAKEPA